MARANQCAACVIILAVGPGRQAGSQSVSQTMSGGACAASNAGRRPRQAERQGPGDKLGVHGGNPPPFVQTL